jgi:NADH:ubiquinone oxidoreductase subunit K
MLKTLLVFAHLIATCAAIGTIVITDLRLAAKAMGYRVVIPPPERFESYLITAALSVLYLTGAAIVWMGWQANSAYLANPKLQAKLMLVVVLTLNAIVLHKMVFPVLSRSRPVSRWSRRDWMVVASSVSLSNSLWFFCAFLGIARAWNGTVSLVFVISVAASMWAIVFALVNVLLTLASRDAPKAKPDWIDSMKASLSDFADLRER